MSVAWEVYLSRLQTLLVFLILNGMAEMKLALLPFLCCREVVKNSNSAQIKVKLNFPQLTLAKLAQSEREMRVDHKR